jgi:hypothetical protein
MRNLKYLRTIFALCIAAFLGACNQPVDLSSKDSNDGAGALEPGKGRLLIVLPAVSARLEASLAAASGARSLGSRSFLFASRAELELRDSQGTLVDSWTTTANLKQGPDSKSDTNRAIAAGSGYSLSARIFNEKVSSLEPVVTGTVSNIAISSGAETTVTLPCVPNPTFTSPLVAGTPRTGTLASAPLGASALTDIGGEAWFKIVASEDALSIALAANNPNGAGYYATIYLFDSTGAFTGYSRTSGSGASAMLCAPVAGGSTYYAGLAYAHLSSAVPSSAPVGYSMSLTETAEPIAIAGTWSSSTISGGQKMVITSSTVDIYGPGDVLRENAAIVLYDNVDRYAILHHGPGLHAGTYQKVSWSAGTLSPFYSSNQMLASLEAAVNDSAPIVVFPVYPGEIRLIQTTIAGEIDMSAIYAGTINTDFAIIAIPTPGQDDTGEVPGIVKHTPVSVVNGLGSLAGALMPGTFTDGTEYVFAIWHDDNGNGIPDGTEACSAASAGVYTEGVGFGACEWKEWSWADFGRPRNLYVTKSDSQATMSWVSAALGADTDYEVQVSTDAGLNWRTIGMPLIFHENASYGAADDADDGPSALYRVRYDNGTVQSDWSVVAAITPNS